ncbi:MAG: ribosome-binding protein aMBF1 (putative translation factor) [Maribacter sp.]|jgi:ribosome-binding protein aMBF1 (putative translation factor)
MIRSFTFYAIALILAIGMASCGKTESFPTKPDNVGFQIKKARMSMEISQQDLAQAIGLSKENLATIEKGMAVPTRDIIVDIEETLGIEIVLDNI